ncbi:MAG TPA: hypothetical protein VEA60_02980 [Allosphingosinicella sp.]|nr:hypothetical protein [Allosphingosinicella sp.]
MKASEADKYKAKPTLADLEEEGQARAAAGGDDHGGHAHSMESVRTATHCGREIVIRTCYEITVDGKPLNAHLSVDDQGNLHTHALPEYQFSSAVDVVKKIVEAFPDEFECDDEGGKGSGHHGHDHGGGASSSGQQGHGHGGHSHKHP